MKVLERHEITVKVTCPYCKSKLELEKGDVWMSTDIDYGSSPYVTCAVCKHSFDVEGVKNISYIA